LLQGGEDPTEKHRCTENRHNKREHEQATGATECGGDEHPPPARAWHTADDDENQGEDNGYPE
jgi:hypothetical protein